MPRHQARPDLPVGRGLVRLCALLAIPAATHRDGRRQRDRGLDARPEIGRGVREAAERTRQEPIGRRAAQDPAHPGSAADPAARLPDQFDAQVDVRVPSGLHAVGQGRRIPHGRAAIQGSRIHPRLDQPEPAADRQPRRVTPPNGARRLWARGQCHGNRARHSSRG